MQAFFHTQSFPLPSHNTMEPTASNRHKSMPVFMCKTLCARHLLHSKQHWTPCRSKTNYRSVFALYTSHCLVLFYIDIDSRVTLCHECIVYKSEQCFAMMYVPTVLQHVSSKLWLTAYTNTWKTMQRWWSLDKYIYIYVHLLFCVLKETFIFIDG